MMSLKTSRVAGAGLAVTLVCAVVAGVGATGASAKAPKAGPSQPEVLYVGSVAGITTPASQTFSTIQAAVSSAQKNDWILVAPGDYHENDDAGITGSSPAVGSGYYGGVVISTSDIHLRGMNRNTVIVDGTASSSPTSCSPAADEQNTLGGLGQNGIVVWKANGVSIDNLTVCNFLAGSGNAGNEIWWNGGDGSGKVGLKDYSGSYLTATSTYFSNSDVNQANICGTCALYGIFSSNSKVGSWDQIYANNFSDSGAYVGACHRACAVTINHAWFENNALGYSGTNSGGQVIIENSTFDNNKEGLDTNTALTGDPPPPQDGKCPGNKATATSQAVPGTNPTVNSCWVFMNNLVASNNDPNVPVSGTAGLGPTGTGMTISGGRDDTVLGNEFLNNGAWGILFAPYPDPNLSSDGKTCTKTGGLDVSAYAISGLNCLYDPEGDVLADNKFSGNGTLGNPSNADFGNLLGGGHEKDNCFVGNTEWNPSFTISSGPATNADSIDGYSQLTPSTCGTRTPRSTPSLAGPNTDSTLLVQAECDAGVLSGSLCSSAHADYPQATSVVMEPLPTLASMPNPCQGVPTNLWCPGGVSVVRG
ncbi:MAG: hypothetical protein ABSG81_11565 [Acidimicrobiales bacterium]|jgi:hypothetical protein